MNQYFPELPDQVPSRSSSAFTRAIFKQLYLAQGWRFVGEFPNLPKAVAIISPHTSNIDAWHGFTALLGLGLQITIFGKNSLFHTPLKPLLEWVGVIPVNRSHAQGLPKTLSILFTAKKKFGSGWHLRAHVSKPNPSVVAFIALRMVHRFQL